MAVWTDGEFEYFSCPLNFIPPAVVDWYREYAYYQEFPGAAPPYTDRCMRFLEAMDHYKSYLVDWEKQEPKKSGSGDALAQLRAAFEMRRGQNG